MILGLMVFILLFPPKLIFNDYYSILFYECWKKMSNKIKNIITKKKLIK